MTLSDVGQPSNSRNHPISSLTYPTRRRLWSWLVNSLPFLRRRFSSSTDISPMPPRDENFEAKLLAALCETETLQAVSLLIRGQAAGTSAKGGE